MSIQEVKVAYNGADPTAFGVMGLSLVCFVASSAKLGFTDAKSTALVVVWAALLGGFVQILAAMIDFKKNNVFGGTVLGLYGFFWVGMAFSWGTMNGMLGQGMKAAVDPRTVSYTHLRAHETRHDLVCRLLLEKKNKMRRKNE